MFKLRLSIVLALLPVIINAAGVDPIRTTSTIKSATVFVHGAELHATAEASLPMGNRDIIVTGVPTTIEPQTIQVSGTGDYTILSVQYHTNFLQQRAPTEEVKRWHDSLELLDVGRRKLNNEKDIAEGLANIIESNKSVAGTQSGLNADAYQKILDIYITRMTKVKSDILAIELALEKIKKKEDNLKAQLQPYPEVATGEIIITVTAKTPTEARLNISYVVNNAGWVPEYDVRCANINSPLTILYKAQVAQNCGMDWKNVRLTINTGNPAQAAYAPPLNPWYLNFIYVGSGRVSNNIQRPNKGLVKSDAGYSATKMEYNSVPAPAAVAADYAYNNTQIELSPVSTEYIIDEVYSIPSDNMQHAVTMQNKTVPVYYEYYAAPKVDKDAFLNAYIVRWDTLNLIAGKANIFFMGNYVGQSVINSDNTSDTMALSLGRDKAIVVKRTALNKFTRTKFLSDKVSKSFGYDISVRNTHNQPISLKLFDQLPLSGNSQIEVTDTSFNGTPKLEIATGKLEWDMKLNGSEERKVNLSFTVKYPKGTNVGL